MRTVLDADYGQSEEEYAKRQAKEATRWLREQQFWQCNTSLHMKVKVEHGRWGTRCAYCINGDIRPQPTKVVEELPENATLVVGPAGVEVVAIVNLADIDTDVLQRTLEGQSQRQIAKALGISQPAVHKRLQRARKHAAALLEMAS